MTGWTRQDLIDMGRCPDCAHPEGDCVCGAGNGARPSQESEGKSATPDDGELRFSVPGRPHGKQRPKLAVTDDGKPHSYEHPETADYETKVGHCARTARPEGWPTEAAYRLEVWAVYPDAKVADVSNVVKAIEDGCENVLWDDDRRVVGISGERQVDRGIEEGHVEVYVEVVGP